MDATIKPVSGAVRRLAADEGYYKDFDEVVEAEFEDETLPGYYYSDVQAAYGEAACAGYEYLYCESEDSCGCRAIQSQ